MSGSSTEIRQLAVVAITAKGWRESRWGYDLFGSDPSSVQHKTFAVGVPSASIDPRDNRQRVSEGLLVRSVVSVQWAHVLKADAQRTSYEAALDIEAEIVSAVRSIETAHFLFERAERTTRIEGYVTGTITFMAHHRYALT